MLAYDEEIGQNINDEQEQEDKINENKTYINKKFEQLFEFTNKNLEENLQLDKDSDLSKNILDQDHKKTNFTSFNKVNSFIKCNFNEVLSPIEPIKSNGFARKKTSPNEILLGISMPSSKSVSLYDNLVLLFYNKHLILGRMRK